MLEYGENGGASMADVLDFGDSIYDATLEAEAYALGPYSSSAPKSSTPAPAPVLASAG